ncbi:MAG: DUF1735 domain-containing protein [Bacteroidales bacterium]|nr:DUF1735 domain-containing protein [Bacteroidales bacterium]
MKKILFVIATLVLAASCIEDSRDNFMVPDSLALVFTDQVVPVSVYAGSATITVQKSGKGTEAAKVTLGVSADSLTAYNAANGSAFTVLDASKYDFSSNTVAIPASAATASLAVKWTPETVSPALDGANSVIPVTISEASPLTVNPRRNLVLLNILNSQVGLASSGSVIKASEEASEDAEVSLKVSVDNVLPMDLKLTIVKDDALVAAYNAEKATSFIAAPDGFVQLAADGYTLKAGDSDCFCDVVLNNSALFKGGKMMDFSSILVPFKISSTSQNGVGIADKVYYLEVKSPLSSAGVSRVWGLFSTEKVWSVDYFPAEYQDKGGDRNLALDKDWVYLPYAIGSSVAKITAISIADPTNTMQVNCEGFVASTITTACVRVIDRGNGTTMLTASAASEAGDKFAFYSWENGIDKAPRIDMLQRTWRRAADRYEFHGTWEDGMVYAHAYQGVFSTRYEVKNGSFVKTDRTLVNVPFTGFGGEYKYPGQDQMLFASSDTSALITPKGTTYQQADGQDTHDMAFEEFPAYKMAYGFRPFTFKGEKYIAYTQYDLLDDLKEDGITPYTSKKRARLVIVRDKGGFKASLDPDERDIFYEAPLQGEDFLDMAVDEPKSAQGDCAVCVLEDKVYIAAGAQGLGVSVFKLE